MKQIFTLILFMFFLSFVNAQNYYFVKKVGENPTDYDYVKPYQTSNNGTTILDKTNNDALSSSQTIPFSFNYYGNSYTSFKACDNGYITFNTSATTASAPGNSIPTGTDPNNAIYAFWYDFELKAAPNTAFPTKIVTYTTGTSPNRRHVIQWAGISKKGSAIAANSDVFAFAIVLYEGASGRFDIIYNAYGASNINGVIGCENTDGSEGVMVGSGPTAFPIASAYNNESNVVYQFNYGTQSDIDPVVTSLTIPRYAKVGTNVNITGSMANYGANVITKLKLNYQINSGPVQTQALNNVNMLGSGLSVANFTHNIPWTNGVAGTDNTVRVWISEPNDDNNVTSDDKTTMVLINNGTSTAVRNILFEEGTGAWCGYCPDGHLVAKNIVATHGAKRVIVVQHHNSDGMVNTESNNINTAFATGYPYGIIDRAIFPANRGTWASEINSRINVNAPVNVTIEFKAFNPTTRAMQFRVKAVFTDYWAGDIRIGAIVAEDNVRGPENNQWSQTNYYSKNHSSGGAGGATHPLYNEMASMVGYVHHNVAKAMPGGAWGVTGEIPSVAVPGDEYFYDFTYTLPAQTTVSYTTTNNTPYCNTWTPAGQNYGYNTPANITLIGYVAEYNNDVKQRAILNAGSDKLWDLASEVTNIYNNIEMMSVYPNPATGNAYLKYMLTEASDVQLTITNTLGQVVYSELNTNVANGENLVALNISNLESGVYFINIKTSQGDSTVKFTMVK